MNFASDQKTEPLLYGILVVLTILTFIADLFLPLGIAVWVIYLFPAALSYFVRRPYIPLVVAAAATILIVLGYVFSPPGGDVEFARINRGFGILTCWIIGITGYFFVQNKLKVQREEWFQTAQVRLAQCMSGEQRLDQLGERVLRFLAEYLNAQAGAIFLSNGGDFRRYSTYGTPDDGRIPSHFKPGDGLLGQAVKDDRTFLLHDVPDNYLYFGSSLGESKPRHLLITPAKADGEVNAALELGFIGDAGEREVELLHRVSQSIGIAVRSAQYRKHLRELLEETQRQAEELQTQSEELRAANEELQGQSRSLQKSQLRLELQQSELEQTNAQLEEQTQLLETQRDELSRTQTSLQGQARELERASRYKSEFLANMSHELRTPLNSLLIMARLLADNRGDNLTSEQIKYANTIETSGNDLLTLINDILDISKIEAGRVELQPERVRIAGMAEKLREILPDHCSAKGASAPNQDRCKHFAGAGD